MSLGLVQHRAGSSEAVSPELVLCTGVNTLHEHSEGTALLKSSGQLYLELSGERRGPTAFSGTVFCCLGRELLLLYQVNSFRV